jgi:hypothetical protein
MHYLYLDAFHVDNAFSNCLAIGGYLYALILVDRGTQYNWTFGPQSLSSDCILAVLCLFQAAAGSLAQCFYCDCNAKIFGTVISEYLIDNSSKIISAPAKRQLSNGLVESHQKAMMHMARAYLIEKQMLCTFWFFTITHATQMMNAIPGKICGHLESPFLLVHGIGKDSAHGFLFSPCVTFIMKKTVTKRVQKARLTRWMVLSLDVLLYNPCIKQCYESNSYRIDFYWLLGYAYRDIKYDGGLFFTLVCDNTLPMEEKYSPGTGVERLDPSTKMLLMGAIMDIPFPRDLMLNDAPSYTILFGNSTNMSIPLLEMVSIIPKPPDDISSSNSQHSLLPPIFCLNSKITYNYYGQYHKGFFGIQKIHLQLRAESIGHGCW